MSLRTLLGFSPDNEASFAAAAKSAQRDHPRVHNYKEKSWGHDLVFRPEDNGLKANISGWGSGLKDGDFILLPTATRARKAPPVIALRPSNITAIPRICGPHKLNSTAGPSSKWPSTRRTLLAMNSSGMSWFELIAPCFGS